MRDSLRAHLFNASGTACRPRFCAGPGLRSRSGRSLGLGFRRGLGNDLQSKIRTVFHAKLALDAFPQRVHLVFFKLEVFYRADIDTGEAVFAIVGGPGDERIDRIPFCFHMSQIYMNDGL